MLNYSYISVFVLFRGIGVKMTFLSFASELDKFIFSPLTVVGSTITPLGDSTVVQGTLNGYSRV